MSSATEEYKKLSKSLRDIGRLLQRIPMTECVSDLQHLKVQSFIFLAHAAFEQYLEEIAMLILDTSVDAYNRNKYVNSCIMNLLVAETIAQVDGDGTRKTIRADVVRRQKDFINLAKRNHQAIIGGNNGVKLRDQRALLLPVGIDPEEVDSVTANSLDAFGVKRGRMAHSVKIQIEETRSSAVADTNTLLVGLKSYDEEARRVINSKFPI